MSNRNTNNSKQLNMKTIIITSLFFLSLQSFAQSPNDSAYTKNLSLKVNTILLFIPRTIDPSNDSLFTVFQKWRTSLRSTPNITGISSIVIDTIPTVELANLYAYTQQLPTGLNIGNTVQNQLTAARLANPYLDRLCTAIEANYSAQGSSMLLISRKLLVGH